MTRFFIDVESLVRFIIKVINEVENGHIGEIISMIIKAGFKIKAMKMTRLTESSAKGFYEVHKERPFQVEQFVFDAVAFRVKDQGVFI